MSNTQQKNRVTFLISSLGGGGAEGVCINIANGLANRGWQVDLVVMNLINAQYTDRVSANINLVNLNVKNARYAFFALKSYLKTNRVKTVLVFNFELAVLCTLIRKLSLVKYNVIARNINTLSQKLNSPSSGWRKFVVMPLIKKFYYQVDHVINQCNAMEADLLRIFPQLQGRTSVIYNPVNQIIEDAAKDIDFANVKKEDYILCVGRLEKQKAFHYAVQAFALVSKHFPDLRLKIVGQGNLENELKDEAKKNGVFDKVDFEGFQKNMVPYYLGARCTLLTSLYEGFPNVLIESITLGTPVVAFDCPSGPSEIVEEGLNGYLAEYLDVKSLATKIKALLQKERQVETIVEHSKKYALENSFYEYKLLLENYV